VRPAAASTIQDDEAREPQGFGPDLRVQFLRGIRTSPGWVILFALLGTVAGVAVGVLQPDTFESKAALLLRVGARERITSESLVGADEQHAGTMPTMLDELQMLSDVAIYEGVARQIGPRELLMPADPTLDDGPLTPWHVRGLHELQKQIFAWTAPAPDCENGDCDACVQRATKLLQDTTQVSNETGSNVINIVHRSSSPERAHQVTEAFEDAFIQRHRQQFSSEVLLEKNRGKLEEAKRDRDAADKAYFEHLSGSAFVDLDAQYPAYVIEIDSIENELFAARVRREEISRQLQLLQTQREDRVPDVEIQRTPIVTGEEYETQLRLKGDLLTRRWNLAFEKLSDEERSSRQRELDAQLLAVDQKLSQIPKPRQRDTGKTDTATRATGPALVDELQSEDVSLSVKTDMLEQRLADKRTHLAEITKQGLVEDVVRRDLAAARDAKESQYQHLLDRFSMLESLVSLDLDDANLQVFQKPTLDHEVVAPKRFSMLLRGLLGGLALGVAVAMLRQRVAPRLWQPDAAEAALGVPVLGVVPELAPLRRMPRGSAAEP